MQNEKKRQQFLKKKINSQELNKIFLINVKMILVNLRLHIRSIHAFPKFGCKTKILKSF